MYVFTKRPGPRSGRLHEYSQFLVQFPSFAPFNSTKRLLIHPSTFTLTPAPTPPNITPYLERRLTRTPLANCAVRILHLLEDQLLLGRRTHEIEALAGHARAVALLRRRVKLRLLVVGAVQRVAVHASAFEGQRREACDPAFGA
jgi:hypothetical protein